jgi:purine-binding chemotaxis protein CheW
MPALDALPQAAAASRAEPVGPGDPAEPEQPLHEADSNPLEGLAVTPVTPEVAAALPELDVEIRVPDCVLAGQSVTFEVRVTNRGSVPATGVQARTVLAAGLRLSRGRRLQIDLGTVAPGKIKTARFRATAVAAGPQVSEAAVSCCEGVEAQARATVSVTESAAAQGSRSAADLPELAVQIKVPESVPTGQIVTLEVRVANRGKAPATGVRAQTILASGLLHGRGRCIEADFGTLAPGKIKAVRYQATAVTAGPQVSETAVACHEGVRGQVRTTITVTSSALQLRLSEPERTPLGNGLRFDLEVSNPGLEPATGVHLQLPIPDGVEISGNSGGADHDRARRSLTWQRATLAPGQLWVVTVQMHVTVAGEVRLQAEARADAGLLAQAEVSFTQTTEQGPEEELGPDPASDNRLEELLAEMDRETEGPSAWGNEIFAPTEARTGTDAGPEEQHIAFSLAGTEYAVPLGSVIEVVRPQRTTPLPNVPEWMTGVTNLRGDVISVVDLRTFLGMEPAALGNASRMLVARSGTADTTTGLLVDRVRRIVKLPEREITAPTAPLEDRVAPYLRGVTESTGRLLVVLDLDRLLLSHEMRQFEPV